MLEATFSISAWFIVFIAIPLVIYFFLGPWNEGENRKNTTSLLAEGAAEGTLPVDNMGLCNTMPVVHIPKNGVRQCAKCSAPAKTRCSRCKSVWYCCGRCQIDHWRRIHKFECLQYVDFQSSSPMPILNDPSSGKFRSNETSAEYPFKYNVQRRSAGNAALLDAVPPNIPTVPSAAALGMMPGAYGNSVADQRSAEMTTMLNGNSDLSRTAYGDAFMSYEDGPGIGLIRPTFPEPWNDAYLRNTGFFSSHCHSIIPQTQTSTAGVGGFRCTLQGDKIMERGSFDAFRAESNWGNLNATNIASGGTNSHDIWREMMKGESSAQTTIPYGDETEVQNCPSEEPSMKRSTKPRIVSNSNEMEFHTSLKSKQNVSTESVPPDTNTGVQSRRVPRGNDNIKFQENNRIDNLEVLSTMGLKKSEKIGYQNHSVDISNKQIRKKMIFSYAEFVKYFRYEVLGLAPRGLVNCGNSCYANAVLQCLMCTKPLITYLLCQSHSRAGCPKDWCLLCEFEQLALMLRESEGPLSPINILTYIRSLNTQIGDGSPEDAHEFLRLLVASMQSICLESFGGENAIDPKLQDTTFIQHAFGGWLRSKVTCLNCNHESVRHEKMMDLTLEIHGQVESVEDALMQFTRPEDLDGDNMYKCLRCGVYVQARKQLNIQSSPNILTIVLKRFQEGNFGKIDKYISFPETLNMVPFMTGTDDVPPLYVLYAIVVHLDIQDASSSAHYVAYVKDMQGNWSRVDDTEVQPVDLEQVMSEEAYILFYMRLNARPTKSSLRHQTSGLPYGKATQHPTPSLANPWHSPSKIQTPSMPEERNETQTM